MSQKIPRLAFDIDGVLARFMQAFMVLLNNNFKTNFHPSQVTEYHPIGAGKLMSKELWDAGFSLMKQTPFFWAKLKPFDPELFADINLDMLNYAFNGYFVTRRANMEAGDICDANTLTRIWLENVGLQAYTSVIAMEHTPRVDILKAMEVDAYIDDWGEQFLECREAGIRAYLMDRPWNQHIDSPYRVYNIRQFVDRVLGRAADVISIVNDSSVDASSGYRLGRIAASRGVS
jgi:uncharacterized HAD superfamily protein